MSGLESIRPQTECVWCPQQGPQKALVDCPLPEVLFGGSRGGGKTDGVLGKWALKERRYGPNFNAIMFRRTTVSAEDAIERSKGIYGPLGGKFNEAKLRWRMPNGGRMAFAYLESVVDADEYQGRNVTDAWIEEAGQYPTSAPIDRLFGVLRSTHVVPVQLILTANPGGAGQHWLRERYGLNPFPRGPKILTRTLPNGQLHQVAVIPSRIRDNQILMQRDPGYIGRLHMVGSADLVRAWLDGDWTAIEGAFFDCWERKHVVARLPSRRLAAVPVMAIGARPCHSPSDGGPSHDDSKLRKVSGFRAGVSSVSVNGTACARRAECGLKTACRGSRQGHRRARAGREHRLRRA